MNNKMACASGCAMGKNDVFVVKLFVRTYLIAKVDVVVALIPMEKCFISCQAQ
jgi:hypothetical protein